MPSQRSSSQGAGATWARPRLKDTPAFCLPRASGSQPVKAARPRPGLTSSTGCPSSNKAQPQLLMVERKRLSFVSHAGGQDLRGDPIWQMWKQVQHGSNFPKATLLLCPPSLQTLPWAALPLDPSLTSSWHGCQGQRLWTTRTLEMVTTRSSLSGWERDPERERSYPRSHGKMRLGLREPVSPHFSSPGNHTKVSGPSLCSCSYWTMSCSQKPELTQGQKSGLIPGLISNLLYDLLQATSLSDLLILHRCHGDQARSPTHSSGLP